MATIIIKKAFEDLDIKLGITNVSLKLNKFVLKMLNWLLHNQKINKLLVTSFLFDLPNHYFSIIVMKIINITLLNTKFKVILDGQDFNQSDDIMYINSGKLRLYLIYKHYIYHGLAFQKLNIYKYFQYISIIKHL